MTSKLTILAVLCSLQAIAATAWAQQIAPKKRPNILMLVADDMNWDTPGCFGGAAPGITPHIDLLAGQGMRFQHAYVNVSICTPSRSVMLTGLYAQNNGAEGFQRIRPGTPNLPSLLNQAGYLCGIIGKPLRQQELFRWSVTYRWQGTGDENRWGRDPAIFRSFAKKFFAMARNSNQPFFLMANSHDPHRPFGGGRATKPPNERAPATRTFSADEVKIPAFLPDLPGVRNELAAYCTSVRRLDDMVREVLEVLKLADFEEDTIVIFLADHGMPFPGAKFNCYVDSVRSPFIIRWPGKVRPGSVDAAHMVTTLDLMPTLLEIAGVPAPKSDGRSFVPLLLGEKQPDRNTVFTQFFHIHGRDALPMRSVLTREAAYVFNPWSNGKRRFDRLGGETFSAMQQAAKTDPEMAARVRHLELRTVEEFFDLRSDPGCLKNLIGTDAGEQPLVSELRTRLRQWMVQVNDPALAAFDARDNPAALEAFIQSYREEAQKEVEALKPYEKAQNFRF
jgi:N-sulfoglucosamine sulfohydrolase